jgi:uncharacterized protein HemX
MSNKNKILIALIVIMFAISAVFVYLIYQQKKLETKEVQYLPNGIKTEEAVNEDKKLQEIKSQMENLDSIRESKSSVEISEEETETVEKEIDQTTNLAPEENTNDSTSTSNQDIEEQLKAIDDLRNQ